MESEEASVNKNKILKGSDNMRRFCTAPMIKQDKNFKKGSDRMLKLVNVIVDEII